jgi:hypothetical protein
MLTNLAIDGSFEDALNNWDCWLAEPTDTSQAKDGSRSLKLGGDALAGSKAAVHLITGHKYYGREYIKTAGELTAADCRFEFCGAVNGVEKAFVFGWNRGNYPDWTAISGIITSDGAYSFGLRTFTVGGSCSAWVDSIVVIDLTAACGAGNEPSKEWCDANIPYFSGSYTVDISLNSPIQMPVEGLKIPIVPDGYTQLEYIESTGVQYFPSITVPRDFKIEVTISAKTTGAYQNIFDNSAAQPMLWIDENKQLELDVNKTGYYMDDNKHHIVVDYLDSTTELYVDGVFIKSFARAHINDGTLFMFNRFGAQCFSGKIYGFKVSDINGVIRECFPTRRNSDGVLGIYDRINAVVYTNAGSGTFIPGPNGGGAVVTQITDASGRVLWRASINFIINGTTYVAERGMTWAEWFVSTYNTMGETKGIIEDAVGNEISLDAVIVNGAEYRFIKTYSIEITGNSERAEMWLGGIKYNYPTTLTVPHGTQVMFRARSTSTSGCRVNLNHNLMTPDKGYSEVEYTHVVTKDLSVVLSNHSLLGHSWGVVDIYEE